MPELTDDKIAVHGFMPRDEFTVGLRGSQLDDAIEDPSLVFEDFKRNPEMSTKKSGNRIFPNSVTHKGWTDREEGLYGTEVIVFWPGSAVSGLRRILKKDYVKKGRAHITRNRKTITEFRS